MGRQYGERHPPGQHTIRCDEWIPSGHDVSRALVAHVVLDDELRVRQMLDIALRIVEAAIPIDVDPVALDLDAQ